MKQTRGAAVESDTIGEQQLKQAKSGSSSQSRCNREAVETDAIGEQQLSGRKRGVAVEVVDAIGEQQLKRTQSEQQLFTERCPAPDYSRM